MNESIILYGCSYVVTGLCERVWACTLLFYLFFFAAIRFCYFFLSVSGGWMLVVCRCTLVYSPSYVFTYVRSWIKIFFFFAIQNVSFRHFYLYTIYFMSKWCFVLSVFFGPCLVYQWGQNEVKMFCVFFLFHFLCIFIVRVNSTVIPHMDLNFIFGPFCMWDLR